MLGPVDPGVLGSVMAHEHLFLSSASWLLPPTDPDLCWLTEARVSPETLWAVRRFPSACRDNLLLDDEVITRDEVARFRAEGGGTLVDLTPIGMIEDRAAVARVSRATGVHVVAGTAYYAYVDRPADFDERTVDALADEFVHHIVTGFPGGDIRAGIIGEIGIEGGPKAGTPWGIRSIRQLSAGDERLLRAAARAARRTGAAVSLHPPGSAVPGMGASSVILDLLDILEDEGLDLARVAVGHLDRDPWETVATLAAIARRGAFVQLDQWGYEGYIHNAFVFPSDPQRVDLLLGLVAEGLTDRLLVGQDVCEKRMWRHHGGQGYGHVLRFIVPVLRSRGLGEDALDAILVRNPARLLTLVAPG